MQDQDANNGGLRKVGFDKSSARTRKSMDREVLSLSIVRWLIHFIYWRNTDSFIHRQKLYISHPLPPPPSPPHLSERDRVWSKRSEQAKSETKGFEKFELSPLFRAYIEKAKLLGSR